MGFIPGNRTSDAFIILQTAFQIIDISLDVLLISPRHLTPCPDTNSLRNSLTTISPESFMNALIICIPRIFPVLELNIN